MISSIFLQEAFTLRPKKKIPMKNLLIISITSCSLFLFSCGQSNPELKNAQEVKDRSEQKVVTGGTASDDLKANAINEGDLESRIKWSLGRVQEEMRKASEKVDAYGEISVLLDDNHQMVIRNKKGLTTEERRVSLANLNTDIKTITIIADGDGVPNPGFKMAILPGKAGIDYFVNGTKKETLQELEIFLGERRQVQLVISALTQAIKTANETKTNS